MLSSGGYSCIANDSGKDHSIVLQRILPALITEFSKVWMATVAIVVLVALVVEIVSQEHVVTVGDVVTDHSSCSDIGKEILQLGGNSVDAAVAAALCLAVAVPHRVGLGGGGVMMVNDLRRNQTVVIDFQEVSPAKLDIRGYTDNLATIEHGPKSSGVPGFLAGLRHAHQKYGSGALRRDCCGWGDLLRGTLHLIASGFPVSGDWQETKLSMDSKYESQQFRNFLKVDGYSRPDSNVTKNMERTLKAIFEDPVKNFYKGSVGKRVRVDLKGHLSEDDLTAYQPVERVPIGAKVGDFSVLTAPAPSAGPELLALLGAVEQMKGEATFEGIHYLRNLAGMLEGLHREARLLGDPMADQAHSHEPGFVSVAERTLELVRRENEARWVSPRSDGQQRGGADAWQVGSHLAVMDEHDLYVSAVFSLGDLFGSRSFSQGFLLNNALANFDLSPLLPTGQLSGEKASSNLLREGRRPLSRMAPVIAVNSATCGLRILAGGPLVEVTGQVLAPLLLSPNGDMTRSLSTPKLVLVNGTVKAESSLDAGTRTQLELDSLDQLLGPTSALEKVQNKATGFSDHRGGRQDNRWATLTPKYIH